MILQILRITSNHPCNTFLSITISFVVILKKRSSNILHGDESILMVFYSALDADECQMPGYCEQECANAIGSFVCDCHDGYTLAEDGLSCQGTISCHLFLHLPSSSHLVIG